ncbi:MAG: radical SAM protein [Candidatus Marinimicrobia bacterium]|nr:radical SAM protein [Candidatus Neomarinimicrobiota bacterium]
MGKVIKEIYSKSILSRTGIGGIDFVINPYVGCSHGCRYCYARFMKRITNHKENWGDFVDVKINAPELLNYSRVDLEGKTITLSSVTDPYQAIEKRYCITRKILEALSSKKPILEILTKSSLILRDVELIKKFDDATVVFSISIDDERLRCQLEPSHLTFESRINALKMIRKNKIHTVLFISPIIPAVTNWKRIIENTKYFVDEFWFENLNPYPSIRNNIKFFIKKNFPELLGLYEELFCGFTNYWELLYDEIDSYCRKNRLNFEIYFHY